MGIFSSLFGSEKECVFIEGSNEFNQEIVGESHYQKALNRICGGRIKEGHRKLVKAILYCEDDNEFDSKAVRVDIDGMTAGYLTRDDARLFRKKLKKAGRSDILISCNAVIIGGWNKGLFDKGSFGVFLDLPINKL